MITYIMYILMIKMYYRDWIILTFNAIFEYTFNLNIYLCDMPSEILSDSLHYTSK